MKPAAIVSWGLLLMAFVSSTAPAASVAERQADSLLALKQISCKAKVIDLRQPESPVDLPVALVDSLMMGVMIVGHRVTKPDPQSELTNGFVAFGNFDSSRKLILLRIEGGHTLTNTKSGDVQDLKTTASMVLSRKFPELRTGRVSITGLNYNTAIECSVK